jgi:hypothetical protein
MKEIRIFGILITDRVQDASAVQKTLTKYGCSIKTRLGLHEVSADYCSNYGLILLEMVGDPAEWNKFENEIQAVKGVQIQKISFEA